jgi:hypothetical protein
MRETLLTLLMVATAAILGAGAFTAAYLVARNSTAPLVITVHFDNPLTVKLVK